MRYTVVNEKSVHALVVVVDRLAAEGWRPHEGLVVVRNEQREETTFFQAMIFPGDDEAWGRLRKEIEQRAALREAIAAYERETGHGDGTNALGAMAELFGVFKAAKDLVTAT